MIWEESRTSFQDFTGNSRGKKGNTSHMNTPIAMSPRDAATSIGVSRSTLYRLIDSGQLRTVKIGRRTLIPFSCLLALLDQSDQVAQ